jgi:hypothetical protein
MGQMYSNRWMSFHLSAAITQNVPKQYRDTLKLPLEDQKAWKIAMDDEFKSLIDRKVWTLTDLPKGRVPIKGRWVYVVKSDGRKKARFVAKGFTQIFGIDYEETFAPVTRFETVRLLLALTALEDWELEALDVKTAYLFGELDEELYMVQPEGFVQQGQEKKVCRLKKSIYGLKQSALAWNKQLHASLVKLGFKRTFADPGVYYKHIGKHIIVLVFYVDDALFMGSDRTLVLQHKKLFMERWESRDLGAAKEYLGMRITRDRTKRTLRLDQSPYAAKVAERFGQVNAKPVSTPLPSGYNPSPNSLEADSSLRSRYQSVIGSLLYIMLGTRPDLAYSVIKMSQYSANPSEDHLQKAIYIVRYLAQTTNLCITYAADGPTNGIIAYSDTDWAGDIETSRSTTGYSIYLGNGIVSWLSKRQKRVRLSSTEAEYCGMTECCKQIQWIRNLFKEISFPLPPVPLCADNQGAIFLASNPAQEGRTKHVRIPEHYIREAVEFGEVVLYFVPTNLQFSDIFTKNLGKIAFERGRKCLTLSPHP